MNSRMSNATDWNGGEGFVDPEITLMCSRARAGDMDSFAKLFDFYIGRLRIYVQGELTKQDRAEGFEDDLANQTMTTVWQGLTGGRFDNIANRDELWFTMMSVAKSRALDRRRYLRRNKRMLGIPDKLASLFKRSHEPNLASDEFEVLEVWEKFAESLPDDEYRKILRMKMEGLDVDEIAMQLDSIPRRVQRKLKIMLGEWEAFVASKNYF